MNIICLDQRPDLRLITTHVEYIVPYSPEGDFWSHCCSILSVVYLIDTLYNMRNQVFNFYELISLDVSKFKMASKKDVCATKHKLNDNGL